MNTPPSGSSSPSSLNRDDPLFDQGQKRALNPHRSVSPEPSASGLVANLKRPRSPLGTEGRSNRPFVSLPEARLPKPAGSSSRAGAGELKGGAPAEVTSPVDLTNPDTFSAFTAFLEDLHASSRESFEKRYSSDEGVQDIAELMREGTDAKTFFAYKDGKVVGTADYSEDPSYERGTVASPNHVVLDRYQRMGIGKQLFTKRDNHMRDSGYKYMLTGIYSENADQIEAVEKHGWKETSDSDPSDGMRHFWKALDPGLADKEPKREPW